MSIAYEVSRRFDKLKEELVDYLEDEIQVEARKMKDLKRDEAVKKESKWRHAAEEAESRRKHLVGRLQDTQKNYDKVHAESKRASAEVDKLKKSCDTLNARLDVAEKELAKRQHEAEKPKKEDLRKAEL